MSTRDEIARALCRSFYSSSWESTSAFRRDICFGMADAILRIVERAARKIAMECWAAGAVGRAVRALGYCRLITYTLPEEGGASLRGAGFTCLGIAGGGTWDRRERPRVDLHPTQQKLRWERSA